MAPFRAVDLVTSIRVRIWVYNCASDSSSSTPGGSQAGVDYWEAVVRIHGELRSNTRPL